MASCDALAKVVAHQGDKAASSEEDEQPMKAADSGMKVGERE